MEAIMEHPLIDKIDDLNIEELQSRINDLNRKYTWAIRTNQHLAAQIAMALETFKNKYQEKQAAMQKTSDQSIKDFSDRIDIS